ncbi:MAG: histone deacetylase family protein [Chloroflexi bacterium]|nr:histone deacetylase family protein [Chloroflexota bacterium]
MQVFASSVHRRHDPPAEVSGGSSIPAWEVPQRAEVIMTAVREAGHDIRTPREFGEGPIVAVHDPAMLLYLESAWREWQAAGTGRASIIPDTLLHDRYREGMGRSPEPDSPCGRIGYWCFDTATPIVAGTYEAARAAVDVALMAAEAVLTGEGAVYGLCRPPGHHAARTMFGGYCYFNNAAIAAEWLVAGGAGRVGILDVDFHHGNGTQQLFYDRADVAYASLHADPARMYPYFSGYAGETGTGDGVGGTFNQPLAAGTGDAAYLVALERALDWLLRRTEGPIVVSLGLDTFVEDPIGDLALTTAAYRECGRLVAASGRPLVILQEGGYHVPTLGANAREWLGGVEQE